MDKAPAVSSWGLMTPECTLSDAPQSKSQTQTFPCLPPPKLAHSRNGRILTLIPQSWGAKREKGPGHYDSTGEKHQPQGKRAVLERGPTPSLGSR